MKKILKDAGGADTFTETDYLIGRACVCAVVGQVETNVYAQLSYCYREAYTHLKRAAAHGHLRSKHLMVALTKYVGDVRTANINWAKNGKRIAVALKLALAA